jgi:putative SOS response-associated peptidase YedK
MCYYVASNLRELERGIIEHDFVLKWQEPSPPETFFVVSGFAHPKLPVITDQKEFKNMRWGLIPSWVKDWESAGKIRVQTLNAISDTIAEKPSYRGALKSGRTCIIPVNGFYEWHHLGEQKYPHFIRPKNSPVFYLAGLYEKWTNQALGETHETFTIVTTAANLRMEWIHNSKKRMPAILNSENAKLWLDTELAPEEKKKLLQPYEVTEMLDHPVSRLITSRKENPNQPAVMEPCDYPELLL